ncbi:MAG: sulfur carrier protein ThiS [Paramuribaculum sp.]|nr:sulfur carrier protein ThiS [Paramuribaculum sp.]
MKVKLNDREVEIPQPMTLAELLAGEGVSAERTATAVNGTVVPASERSTFIVGDGDSILVIKAFYGG